MKSPITLVFEHCLLGSFTKEQLKQEIAIRKKELALLQDRLTSISVDPSPLLVTESYTYQRILPKPG